MEITREDISNFYAKYLDNLEEEAKVNAMVLHATDEDDWVKRLEQENRIMLELYRSNEALISKYLTPFLNYEIALTEDIAEEFLNQITSFFKQGFNDYLVGVEVGYLLEKYYENSHEFVKKIKVWHVLGSMLSRFSDIKALKNSLKYFDKEKQMMSFYKEIDDWPARRAILLSPNNYCIVLLLLLTYIDDQKEKERYQSKLLYELVAAIKVYEKEELRSIDGDKFDFNEVERLLKNDICGG